MRPHTWKTYALSASLGLASLASSLAVAQEKNLTNAAEPGPGERSWEASLSSGFPHPVEVGVGRRWQKTGLLGVYAGKYERSLNAGKFDTLHGRVSHLESRYRQDSLGRNRPFWALALGYQEIELDGAKTIVLSNSGYSVPIEAKARLRLESFYWAPQFGWTVAQQKSLQYNVSIGLQIPLYARADITTRFSDDDFIDESVKSTKSYQDMERDAEDIGARLGRLALPIIKLIDLVTSF